MWKERTPRGELSVNTSFKSQPRNHEEATTGDNFLTFLLILHIAESACCVTQQIHATG